VSVLSSGLACRCPRCGHGRLFQGYLNVVPACASCGLDLTGADSADGPAVFIIFIVGALVVPLALMTEAWFEPPIWVHMLLWGPMILGVSLGLLRPAKSVMIALQFKHRAGEARSG
jgi:uncharacterized protein (DUF983 family)